MAQKKAPQPTSSDTSETTAADSVPQCGLCGKTSNLIRTECCGNWICDDEHEYRMFSYDRNSCHRNHRRYTLCAFHHTEQHTGDWKGCAQCREAFDTEMYVYYSTNEYNFEVLQNPPSFEPTKCCECGKTISRGDDGYTAREGRYYCQACASGDLLRPGHPPEDESSDDFAAEDAIAETVNDVMAQLEAGYHQLPVDAIRAVQADPGLYIPELIASLEEATAAVAEGEPPSGQAHFFALFLLTELQAHEAWPAIRAAISLPGEGPFDLFGDAVTERLGFAMAVFLADRVEELEELLLMTELNEYVRGQCSDVYLHWVCSGRMTREEAVTSLRKQFRQAMELEDSPLVTALVCTLYEFAASEASADIAEAFDRDLVDPEVIGFESIEEAMASPTEHFERALSDGTSRLGRDTVAELSKWASFAEPASKSRNDRKTTPNPELARESFGRPSPVTSSTIRNKSPKVGRNDPCPCGSGKKYKKCCGR